MTGTEPTRDSRVAMSLALFGYVPFLALTIALFLSPLAPHASLITEALSAYAAIILSFLGGIRWGIAVKDDEGTAFDLGLSVLPSLWGWMAFMLASPSAGFALFAIGFAAAGYWDWRLVQVGGAPAWFGKLRAVLTLLVAPTLAIAAFATA